MTECSEIRKKIDLFLDGLLDPQESKRIEDHLVNCQECAAEARETKAFDLNASKIKRVPVNSSLQSKIMESLINEIEKQKTPVSQEDFINRFIGKLNLFWKPAIAVAAIILAIILTSPFSGVSPQKPRDTLISANIKCITGKPQLIRNGANLMTEKGPSENQVVARLLPNDRILAPADSESEIDVPGLVSMKIRSNTEIEWRNGEIFIHRGKSTFTFPKLKDPFFVKTPHLEIEIVGTELGFNVTASQSTMYLVEGTVSIKEKNKFVQVKAGSMVSAETGMNPVVTAIPAKKDLKELLKNPEGNVTPNDSKSW